MANVSNLTSNLISEDVQIIFDSGSQGTYVSDSLRKRLKLQIIRTERIIINTFGNDEIRTQDTDIVLMKLCTDSKIFFVETICSPIICTDLASQNHNFASKEYEHLKNLNLADKSEDGNKTVEILIGLNYYYQFMTGKIIKGKINEPVALESYFGWILSGQYKNYTAVNLNETHFLKINMQLEESFGDTLNSFDKKIEQFLNTDYDDCVKEKSKSLSDEFGSNLKHSGSQYEVTLPFTCSKEMIPDNYLLAKIRTEHLLTRLNKNKPLLKNITPL